ncbi:ABC transporter ATP-binding protein [Fimbriimonas ginsengisoli]|uniref:Lipid A ABC exporter, fused ATPase and inner membrane subunits MsbA n=1 Tax=Fimbriimonas ginsengisoli Gsoil 348 TaxID=661478 RepID=A0A068NQ36_FIMGI|nr:ABC transporter ATP-binding protein [Fimbriimonas ginsengisoli]AIE85526.1 lipid A ABC exporter, fused ATPase and inner membrane subunits MsbA [Fimbriimonas ginsengisoli Gsoil 348]
MKKIKLIPKFDQRLTADLKQQRSSIVKGLLCVLATSLLTTATIPLISWSVTAIQEAAPLRLTQAEAARQADERLKTRAHELAPRLGVPEPSVLSALREVLPATEDRAATAEEGLLVDRFHLERTKVHNAVRGLTNNAAGDLSAVRRLGWISLFVILVYACKYWFTRGQTYYLSRAAARLASDLRIRLFRKLQRLPVSYFHQKRAGAIQSVLTNDVNVYQNAVSVVRDSIDAPVKALASFGAIMFIQPVLAIVAMLFIPVMAAAISRNSRKMRAAQAKVQDDLSDLNAMSTESLMGIRVVKAFAAEERVATGYEGLVDKTYGSQMDATKRQASLRPLVELLGAAALATILYICGWLSYMDMLRLGDVAALLYALDVINQGFRSWGNVNNTYSQVQAASQRIYREVLDEPEPIDQSVGRTIENPRGRIEFENVTFRYEDGTEALRNVNFTLAPGTSLALVGPSGAGKSTIADLVLRFYEPTEGRILFDGVDLRELKTSWLREQIGVVPQQTFLFAGTIADNLRLGAPDATQEDIEEASRMSHTDEFVHNLPARFETKIGEGGSGLSGGQRQRLAIGRALARKPTLLLLDEATSALDATSEKAVTEALDEVMRQRTTLFIAHRLTTAARADRILVLSKGEVVEEGSHMDLMEANGAYAGLFRAFSGGILD